MLSFALVVLWSVAVNAGTSGPDYTDLGCWKEESHPKESAIKSLEWDRDMLDGHYGKREEAIEKCYQAARKHGLDVFAVGFGGWCRASADAAETYMKHGKADNCKADGEGAYGSNQVYKINKYTDLGCWKEEQHPKESAIASMEYNRTLLDGHFSNREDAIEKCYQAARDKGFEVFAVGFGGWCRAEADAGLTYRAHGKADNCNADGEGAYGSNQVYRINRNYIDMKCWRNKNPQQVTRLEGKHESLDKFYQNRVDAVHKCYQAAKDGHYNFFGVGNNGQCWAGYGEEYTHYGPVEKCPEHGEGYYGVIHVYVIGVNEQSTLELGAACSKKGDSCKAENSVCRNYHCKCRSGRGYVKGGDKCVAQSTLELGSACTDKGSRCAAENSVCRNKHCRCRRAFRKDGDKCVEFDTDKLSELEIEEKFVELAGACNTEGEACNAPNSVCRNHHCKCKRGHTKEDGEDNCIPQETLELGAVCTKKGAACKSANSNCSNKHHCRCKKNFVKQGDDCVDMLRL